MFHLPSQFTGLGCLCVTDKSAPLRAWAPLCHGAGLWRRFSSVLDWALQVDWLSPLFLYGRGPGWVNEEGTEQAASDSSDYYLNPWALSETCFVQDWN